MTTLRQLLVLALACLVCLAAMPGLERVRARKGGAAVRRVLALGWSAAGRPESPARSGREALSALEEEDEDADPSRHHEAAKPRRVKVEAGALAHPHEVLLAQLAARGPAALYLLHCLLLV